MTATLDRDTPYAPSPDAMESRLGEETVILHLGSGTYFGLDAVGTVVWEQLQQTQAPQAVCAHLRQVYPEAPPTMEAEVTSFMAELLAHDLIRPV